MGLKTRNMRETLTLEFREAAMKLDWKVGVCTGSHRRRHGGCWSRRSALLCHERTFNRSDTLLLMEGTRHGAFGSFGLTGRERFWLLGVLWCVFVCVPCSK